MLETITQTASLGGHVIEDVSFAPLTSARYSATLLESADAAAVQKDDGFFVFVDVRPGKYTLQLTGTGLETKTLAVSAPSMPILASQPGQDEIFVIALTVNGSGLITFAPIALTAPVPAGAPVRALGLTTTLLSGLDAGQVSQARLAGTTGLAASAVVRLVRSSSIRLRFNPYYAALLPYTRIVGHIREQAAPERPVAGAVVSLQQVAGLPVQMAAFPDLNVAFADLTGGRVVLGAERDISVTANAAGDYGVYFSGSNPAGALTFGASAAGFLPQTQTVTIAAGERHILNFQLTRA